MSDKIVYLLCPKCRHYSGDSWGQCRGFCPVEGSPHFDPEALRQHGPLIEEDTPEEARRVANSRVRVYEEKK